MKEIFFNSRILWNPFLIGVFLIRIYHGVQGILRHGAQVKDMLDPLRHAGPVSFILSTSHSVYAFWSSRLCIDDLEVQSSASGWTVNFMESSTSVLAKSLDTIGPSPRPQELPLSTIPYSITSSALARSEERRVGKECW